MTASEWYCQQGGAVAGPYTVEELNFLASRGEIVPESQVCRCPSGPWTDAADVKGLFRSRLQATELKTHASETSQIVSLPSSANYAANASESVGIVSPNDAKTGPVPPPLPNRRKRRLTSTQRRLLVGGAAVMLLLLALLALLNMPVRETAMSGGAPGARTKPGEGLVNGKEKGRIKAESSTQGDSSKDARKDEAGSTQGGGASDVSARTIGQDALDDTSAVDDEKADDQVNDFTVKRFRPEEQSVEGAVLGNGRYEGPRPVMFKNRDSEARFELALKDGGSRASEAAVDMGLQWLVRHQHKDGRWSLEGFHTVGDCNGQCDRPGISSDAAATGLALMPLLGAGHTHGDGEHKESVRRGLEWLIKNQDASGRFQSVGGGSMYAQGQATIALCEAYAMTKDDALLAPAQRAVDYICQSQHKAGGWRYSPGVPGDTSVTGWQVLAIKSAASGGLKVPSGVFPRVNDYLDSVQVDKLGGRYAYMRNSRITRAMTAEGLLCRQYCGWPKDKEGLRLGVSYLLENPPDPQRPDLYYWYYATQVMHHNGGSPWNEWNEKVRTTVVGMQETNGHEMGSWTPRGGHSGSGGRIYMTSLSLCILEIYYRHAALFE